MAAHSSILAWRIPGTGAWWAAIYGVTQSWQDWRDLAAAAAEYNLANYEKWQFWVTT